ncbi:dTDP-4-dehydrorhamnose reductase [Litoreibacter ponti]|uniref:dTDP-4-dehydrorhamnose reductase n=1 Tax=Litoreibacter ponti TaxID=1510457 RepID=A0A2T6BP14_9RHOB|nr:dTDP-4-dehydrorhamnose reductase [Litoreibacter ponti]PTX57727.1 dTDP-4-dehydrorhamnose reductase [Litoreibacter ponti]
MTILVFGKTGQVARHLANSPDVRCVGRDQADLEDPAACEALIAATKPAAVINAAAFTAVDDAEEDEARATLINGDAPGAMARACATLDIPFIQISTDYVLDGKGSAPHLPESPTRPLNAYGRSKLAGEQQVQAAGGRYAILRTSWVFSAHGANFLKTMLRLSQTRDSLTIVGDQVGGPTAAGSIASACLSMAKQMRGADGASKAGIYHFSGAPDVSWADFARAIFAEADRHIAVTDIPTAEYKTPAIRPLNSRLDCSDTERVFGIKRPDWRKDTADIVEALT